MVERDSLRKELDIFSETMNVKEKECARLIEDRENLEKKLHQLQVSEDSTNQEKMATDYEVSKIKVSSFNLLIGPMGLNKSMALNKMLKLGRKLRARKKTENVDLYD